MKLYHGTFLMNAVSIQKEGLIPDARRTSFAGEIYQGGVYLAFNEDVAVSFAETADNVSDSVYDTGIVCLVVMAEDLSPEKFLPDKNILEDSEEISVCYCGKILPHILGVLDTDGNIHRLQDANLLCGDYLLA